MFGRRCQCFKGFCYKGWFVSELDDIIPSIAGHRCVGLCGRPVTVHETNSGGWLSGVTPRLTGHGITNCYQPFGYRTTKPGSTSKNQNFPHSVSQPRPFIPVNRFTRAKPDRARSPESGARQDAHPGLHRNGHLPRGGAG